MALATRALWFRRGINFAFISWGILFLLGMAQGLFKSQFRTQAGLNILLVSAVALHLSAFINLLIAFYNGVGYLITRFIADQHARN